MMILACAISKDGGLKSVKIVFRSLSTQVIIMKMPGGTPKASSTSGIITSTSFTVKILFSILVRLRRMQTSRSTRLQLSSWLKALLTYLIATGVFLFFGKALTTQPKAPSPYFESIIYLSRTLFHTGGNAFTPRCQLASISGPINSSELLQIYNIITR